MYRLSLLSCGNAPVGKGLLTTTAIEPDLILACSVSDMPGGERTDMTILDPITGNVVTIDTSSRPRR
jgi:hypothetical protein